MNASVAIMVSATGPSNHGERDDPRVLPFLVLTANPFAVLPYSPADGSG
jgi:hypothetical protein